MSLDLRLALTDQPVGDIPYKMTCPPEVHKARSGKLDKQQSLAVYHDHLHCFGCGFHLEPWGKPWAPPPQHVEPLAFLLGTTYEEAKAVEHKYHSETIDAYRERAAAEANAEPLPASLAEVYSAVLMKGPRRSRCAWLEARGLTYRTMDEFKLGHDGVRFVIPVWNREGKLITLRYRRDDEYLDDKYPKYSGMKGRNGLYLYGEWLVPDDATELWITEGELDAIRLWQEGLPAVSATNGAGQVHKLPALIKERWPLVHTLYIATDQDEPGHEAARLTKQTAEQLGFRTERLTWPEEAKDVTEAAQYGFLRPRDLLGLAA